MLDLLKGDNKRFERTLHARLKAKYHGGGHIMYDAITGGGRGSKAAPTLTLSLEAFTAFLLWILCGRRHLSRQFGSFAFSHGSIGHAVWPASLVPAVCLFTTTSRYVRTLARSACNSKCGGHIAHVLMVCFPQVCALVVSVAPLPASMAYCPRTWRRRGPSP